MTDPRPTVLGVKLHPLRKEEVLHKVKEWLKDESNQGKLIVTVNAEFILAAQKDNKFQDILNNADMSLVDGVGPQWAAHFLAKPAIEGPWRWAHVIGQYFFSGGSVMFQPHSITDIIPEKIPGSDLIIDLCAAAAVVDKPTFLLGGGPGVADLAAVKLHDLVPGLSIVGTHGGSKHEDADAENRAMINGANPSLLFVAFGAPAQEKWIDRNIHHMPSIKVAIGVGGSFDFLAEAKDPNHPLAMRAKQPPKYMRMMGLDWLYRLITQPYRCRRVWNAVVVFSIKVLIWKIKNPPIKKM